VCANKLAWFFGGVHQTTHFLCASFHVLKSVFEKKIIAMKSQKTMHLFFLKEHSKKISIKVKKEKEQGASVYILQGFSQDIIVDNRSFRGPGASFETCCVKRAGRGRWLV
jgi:hypothetical protein